MRLNRNFFQQAGILLLKLCNFSYRVLILAILTVGFFTLMEEHLDLERPEMYDMLFAFLVAGWCCVSTDLSDWFLSCKHKNN